VYSPENEKEVLENTKNIVEYSANSFQKKLINGFYEKGVEAEIISAPFIGAYPIGYKKMWFKGFHVENSVYQYVRFNNIWGFRNISRAYSLKKELMPFVRDRRDDKRIIIYSAHTPFLEAAAYAKKKDPSIRITMIVPDLPRYMNLNTHKSVLYRFCKLFDIRRFEILLNSVDSFMLLTAQMKDQLPIGERKSIVVEGLVDQNKLDCIRANNCLNNEDLKYIVYTGKMNIKFGIIELIDAFGLLSNSKYRLILCGQGDAFDYAKRAAANDDRISCLGQVPVDVAEGWMNKASVLVNPRPNNEEYTKYSFPSKNIEYLLMGKPVVAYMLDGMPSIYRNFLYIPADETLEELARTICFAMTDYDGTDKRQLAAKLYMQHNLTAGKVAEKILKL
jgi:glycosyltransferase involved in cell wall biosynthesis